MPDISMCRNTKCQHSKTCYRFLATPDERQSYISASPDPDGTCEYYIFQRKVLGVAVVQKDEK